MNTRLRHWWIAGVAFAFVLIALPRVSHSAVSTLDSVIVIPNPYNLSGRTYGPQPPGGSIEANERIRFANLPAPCTIKIYTSAGNLVSTIQHTGAVTAVSDLENYYWSGRNADNQYIVSDVYIYVVESPTLGRRIGKFIVIR
ncbi:MAG TPA: hypothetical protein PLE60_11940 [Candidatus Latescibacteria bacterium]|nr:MAG: hypothetical protein BWY06_03223 [Candidatus Latescibacteria bacterium ADurb.Bin168]HPU86034.1 hypothetical protein [Candidatus Latescibacterota bacterium]